MFRQEEEPPVARTRHLAHRQPGHHGPHPTDSAASEPWPEPNLNVPPDDTPEGHRIRSRTTWLLARHDYLQGDSADQVCARYGLKERTLRDRSRREGWRRCDQPDPEPAEDEVDDSPVDCAALADEALMRVRTALRRRRPGEAASWMRVHEKLVRRAAELAEVERRSRRVDDARGAFPAVDDSFLSVIELARTRLNDRLKELQAEIARETDDPAAGLSHPSHPNFSGDDDDGLDGIPGVAAPP